MVLTLNSSEIVPTKRSFVPMDIHCDCGVVMVLLRKIFAVIESVFGL